MSRVSAQTKLSPGLIVVVLITMPITLVPFCTLALQVGIIILCLSPFSCLGISSKRGNGTNYFDLKHSWILLGVVILNP